MSASEIGMYDPHAIVHGRRCLLETVATRRPY
eukprot:CAMPEP_0177734700 /NCGR_PEP_ID=MMETSP0484_2-20121128/24377_1 /TAXON_ID=354590 /ORGANISM="Rhodomonas lens, Strain RHODO" /LENGTH=31 /DNA_ID= /DNA_START= /DNA_END= /DNA_ORIENTATION=